MHAPDEPINFETEGVPPHKLGWLRRPECDLPGGYVWEKPNGELVVFKTQSPILQVKKRKR